MQKKVQIALSSVVLSAALLNPVAAAAAPPLSHPRNNARVWLLDPNYRQLIPPRRYTDEKNKTHAAEIVKALPVKFSWQKRGKAPYTLTVSPKKDFSESVSITVNASKAELYNLFTNTKYFAKVQDARKKIIAQSTFRTGATPRWIRFPEIGKAPLNFRDLGFWPTVDGKQVKQGMVYRGADLNEWLPVSRKNWEFMTKTLKIRSEIDMRYPFQVKKQGLRDSRLGKEVKFYFRPVNAYNSFTPEQNNLFRDTIKLFADPDNYPIYLHCSGGVDRTGEIAFLINGLLGVPEEKLFEDYESSSLSLFPRSVNIDYFKKYRVSIAAFAPAGAPVQQQITNYLLKIGITQAEIDSIRNILLEDKQN